MGDEKGAACCGEVSFFISTLISPGQPQGREEEQNAFSSTSEPGGLDGPEGSLSVRWLLNPAAQQSSGCHSSMPPGPASSQAERASHEAHTHRSMHTTPIHMADHTHQARQKHSALNSGHREPRPGPLPG